DFLPEQIINKPKHGFGLPFGEWLRSDPGLRDMTDTHLSNAASRGLVQTSFVDKLIAAHRDEHAAYYGTMIGALLMLELWLAVRPAGADWSGAAV
ncbi:MAG: asparagine synthase-related protein, partial [Pseudomonadota bacterium]